MNRTVENNHDKNTELSCDRIFKNHINAFTLMMANRHKQDEIIEELIEQEKEITVCEDDFNSNDCIVPLIVNSMEDKSNCGISISTNHMKDKVGFSSSEGLPDGKLNAFHYLMCNRTKDNYSEEESDPSYDPPCIATVLKKKKPVKKTSKTDINDKHIVIISDDSFDSTNVKDSIQKFNHQSVVNEKGHENLGSGTELNVDSRKESFDTHCDLKLNLINENEYFTIEETFKEEILECVSKKKRKTKRKEKLKYAKVSKVLDSGRSCLMTDVTRMQDKENLSFKLQNDDKHILLKEKENLFNDTNSCETRIVCNSEPLDKNTNSYQKCLPIPHQPDIKTFFKSLDKSGKKVINNEKIDDPLDCSYISQNCNVKLNTCTRKKKVLSNEIKVSSTLHDNHVKKPNQEKKPQQEESYCNTHLFGGVTRSSSSKLKTKALRETRIFINNNNKILSDPSEEFVSNKNKLQNEVKDGPVLIDEDGPVLIDEDGPVLIDEDGPVLIDEDGPVLIDEDGPVLIDEDGPVLIDEDGPVLIDEDGPVLIDEDKPSVENKLRRSSRNIKKPKFFDIFSEIYNKKLGKVSDSRENNSGSGSDSDFEVVIEKSTVQNVNGISEKGIASNLKKLSLKDKKQNLRKDERHKNSSSSSSSSKVKDPSETEIITLDTSSTSSDVRKIAPIFVTKKPIAISPSKLKARLDFLFPDVPEILKELTVKSEEQNHVCPFPTYSHVKQVTSELFWNLPEPNLSLVNESSEDVTNFSHGPFSELKIGFPAKRGTSNCILSQPPKQCSSLSTSAVCHILAYLKSKNKSFPVMSVFNAYKASKEEYLSFYEEYSKEPLGEFHKTCKMKPNTLDKLEESPSLEKKTKRKNKGKYLESNKRRKLSKETQFRCDEKSEDLPIWHKWIPYEWIQVFAPVASEFLIGNSGPVISLKDWLTNWNAAVSSECSSEKASDDSSDSEQYEESVLNTVLITGPSGIGKTAAVYAVAQDFGYKVLEVNASSSRQGKQILSQLSEATQSHTLSSANTLQGFNSNSLDQVHIETSEQVEKNKSVSLILIEDIDIVFEDVDDGFWSAVNTLLSTSKRPIIMTSSLDTSAFTSRIKENYWRLYFTTPEPQLVAQHLQLMCLANGAFVCSKEIELLVKSNQGDIRKSILDLQFWILSGTCQVCWWKVDNGVNLTNALKLPDTCDMNIQKLFPCARKISSNSLEIPITLGCIWNKTDTKLLREQERKIVYDPPLNWTLLSANCDSLLPFVKKEKKREWKYPLKEDDPILKNTSLWQKYSWLSIDDESDTEKEIPSNIDHLKSTKSVPSKELERSCHSCLSSLSSYFNSFADFDIFSFGSRPSEKSEYIDEFRNKWWTPSIHPGLESVNSESPFLSYSNNLNLTLIPEISELSLKRTQDQVLKAVSSFSIDEESSPLHINIEQETPSVILHPHCHLSHSDKLHLEDLNIILLSLLPCLPQLHRSASVMDYLPFLREIARSDQLGESVKKYFKRTPRLPKYFRYLGYHDVPPPKLLDICNVFQSS